MKQWFIEELMHIDSMIDAFITQMASKPWETGQNASITD
jgi:hypothetical protein